MKDLNFRNLIIQFLIVIISFQLCRLLFYTFNFNSFEDVNLLVFLGGLRFDISIIAYCNLFFVVAFLVSFIIRFNSAVSLLLNYLFIVINSLITVLNFIDFEYYKFTGIRSTSEIIFATGMQNELPILVFSFMKEYWYLLILAIVFVFLFKTIVLKFYVDYSSNKSSNIKLDIFKLLGFIIILFIGARGGFQPRPLKAVDALNYASVKNTAIVLNTPFCVSKSFFRKDDLLKELNFFTKDELIAKYNPIIQIGSESQFKKKNIIFIILESFGNESIGNEHRNLSYTPFLDSLLTKSIYFKNSFANGRRSVSSVPALISSIPQLMERSYVDSRYIYNDVKALPVLLKEEGYYSAFFHGAKNGSQNFDRYAKVAGFTDYFGMNEYPEKSHYDGRWGIFDHQYLSYCVNQINTFKAPFFSTIFTLSSHFPYTIPKGFENKYPKGELKIHESIGYADAALRNFFNKAKKQTWYNNTVFVLTADHCSSEGKGFYASNLGKYRIPIAIFDPSNITSNVITKPFQQIDVLPTLLDYLDYKGKIATFGNSGFSKQNLVAFYHGNVFHFVKDNYYFQFNGSEILKFINLEEDLMQSKDIKLLHPDLIKSLTEEVKAYIQTYNHSLITNAFKP